MSAMQRRKGANGENEVAKIISETLGITLKRNLGQAREGGDDLTLPKFGGGRFRVEVKRRNTLAVERFLEQAQLACRDRDVPIVLMRADGGRWISMMWLDEFLPMLGGELAKEGA